MSVRAKMRVVEKTERPAYPTDDERELGFTCAIEIKLQPMYEMATLENGNSVNAIEENRIFGLATPSAQIGMFIKNPGAAHQFTVGKDYYVDFTQVDEA